MPNIAISYRRSDSSAIAGRIFDHLTAHYGVESIFMDVDKIPLGTDFRTHIHETLQGSDVLIAVVGSRWLGPNDDGTVRMDELDDPVRVEIETAVTRKLQIIPVLVEGAKMPASKALPASFGNFAFLNAADVVSGREFRDQMERLIEAIDHITGHQSASAVPFAPLLDPTLPGRLKGMASTPKEWMFDALRYVGGPFALLLAAEFFILSQQSYQNYQLVLAAMIVPFAFGFALYWIGHRGTSSAVAFAVALGILGASGMTMTGSLISGDPVMPHGRKEWSENVQYAGTIALSFVAGHIAAYALQMALSRKIKETVGSKA
jgi:hypothetical protein